MQSYGPQICGNSNYGNFKTPIWESQDKMSFGCWSMANHKIYYKVESGGFPQVWAVVSFMNPSLPVAQPSTKSAQTMH
jgi:hypothetical protein